MRLAIRLGVQNFAGGCWLMFAGSAVTCVQGAEPMAATVSSVHASATVTTDESRTR